MNDSDVRPCPLKDIAIMNTGQNLNFLYDDESNFFSSMLISLLPPTNSESFAEIGPAIWESIGYKVQETHRTPPKCTSRLRRGLLSLSRQQFSLMRLWAAEEYISRPTDRPPRHRQPARARAHPPHRRLRAARRARLLCFSASLDGSIAVSLCGLCD